MIPLLQPPWYTWALAELGVAEVPGMIHNPRIIKYWSIGRVPLSVNDDEVPWCAAFVSAAIESVGYRSARTARARGFDLGNCDQGENQVGTIIVLSSDRGAASGHVGFLSATSPGRVHVLGGNQGNKVSIAPFPESRVVHRLWPKSAPDNNRYSLAPVVKSSGSTPSDR